MIEEQTLIPVDMDQEDVALRFQKYALSRPPWSTVRVGWSG
jgi:hypothetical protein